MKNQPSTQIAGVREKCMPGVGATPVRRTCRVGFAALVAPTPGLAGIRRIFDTDTSSIRARYKPD